MKSPRYAAGFVPFTLMTRHEKSQSTSSATFVDCLIGMAVNGIDVSFLEYTKQWIHNVNSDEIHTYIHIQLIFTEAYGSEQTCHF